MRKGNLCFVLLFLVLFYWPNLALSHTDLFPEGDIDILSNRILPISGLFADVYFPNPIVRPADDAFPIVSFLQGAAVEKIFYSGFALELARYGFVVVIPNRSSPPVPLPDPFPDEFLILDVLALMIAEDNDPNSPLSDIVDADRMGLAGHSAGGAASLFAIGGSCQPPFCFGPPDFPLPDVVRGGAFYGTNTIPPGGSDPIPVMNTNGIPVAFVQGTKDGISTLEETERTIEVIKGEVTPEPILILDKESGANHYGITDFPNAPPPFNDPNETNTQEDSRKLIAQAMGQFLRTHVGIDLSVSSSSDRSNTMPLEGTTLSGDVFIFLTPCIRMGISMRLTSSWMACISIPSPGLPMI
jgi:hypothetical protein